MCRLPYSNNVEPKNHFIILTRELRKPEGLLLFQ